MRKLINLIRVFFFGKENEEAEMEFKITLWDILAISFLLGLAIWLW